MVSHSFKITFLGAAVIALLAMSHVEAVPTPAEIEKYGKDYAARVLQPTSDYYKCRSDCYTEGLQSILAPDNLPFMEKLTVAADIVKINACVANEISGFTSFDKIVAYEKKRGYLQFTVAQFCVDEVMNKGKPLFGSGNGKLQPLQALAVQGKLLQCSISSCDPDYVLALLKAAEKQ
ncbi:hypothetical protein BGZ93_011065 [Podila epicladia]|nr:hypothetical protein BGZ92_010313 [Podila epicladia]KAG0087260.1 hypothetical protein BGZ93_011065 [Podila epicladia]